MSNPVRMSMPDMIALTNAVATVMREYVDEIIRERTEPLARSIDRMPQHGVKGDRGEAGRDGVNGSNGERGEKGDRGVDGKDGRDGRDGKDGENGRDALEVIDILPAIDEAKSYARGTLASHAGGLWRATNNTKGLEGWVNVIEGVSSVTVVQTDERTLAVQVTMSSGRKEVHEFEVPTLIERGIYSAERTYKKGDGVTYGGSFWIAQQETKDKPGDNNTSWRLAVKKGRDGKDGERGPKGDAGPNGRDGRDLTQMGPDGQKW